MHGRTFLSAIVVLTFLTLAAAAAAETNTGLQIPDSWSNIERWAWKEIRAGRIVDFNQRYNKELDPKQPEDWNDPKKDRRLSQDFLKTIIIWEPFRGAIPDEGVEIIGAWLPEKIDLAYARLTQQLWLDKCRSDGGVDLTGATIGGVLSTEGSTFEGDVVLNSASVGGQLNLSGATFKGVNMDSLEVKQSLLMREGANFEGDVVLTGATIGGVLSTEGSTFEGDVVLNSASVGGQLSMIGSTFKKGVNMDSLEVKQSLFMSDKANFEGDVVLNSASVGGQLSMIGSTFKKGVNMDSLEVKSHLVMSDKANFEGNVNLNSASVGGQLSMIGSTFKKGVNMDSLEVKQSLFMSDKANFEGNVNLNSASVGGQLNLSGATFKGVNMDSLEVKQSLFMREGANFEGNVNLNSASVGGQLSIINSNFKSKFTAERLNVGSHLLLNNATFAEVPEISFGHIGGGLDLGGTKLPGLDLSSTVIVSDLSLNPPPQWSESAPTVNPGSAMERAVLSLRNVHVGALQDADGDAWPRHLDHQGFVYDRLGGYGSGTQAMLLREASWYVDWLERDQTFTRQPYQQLAAVFRAAGDSDRADAILYAARDRELTESWREGKCGYGLGLVLLKGKCWDAAGLGLLKISIGYGLGSGLFLILVWVMVFTAIGGVVLWFSPAARAKGLLWCLGASLDHLLPIVELNKEFTGFLDDPDRKQLSGRQLAYFAVHALIGYVLASFVVAGLAGLTQAR